MTPHLQMTFCIDWRIDGYFSERKIKKKNMSRFVLSLTDKCQEAKDE